MARVLALLIVGVPVIIIISILWYYISKKRRRDLLEELKIKKEIESKCSK